MDPVHVATALASAVLHAGWNAAVKASPRPTEAMTAQMILSAALTVPLVLWTGLPATAAYGWIAATTALNMITITALLRAYAIAGFGVAYPVSRALAVMIVVPLAVLVSGETLSPSGATGVALIAVALLVLGLDNRGAGALPRAALGWIGLAGVSTAAYVMCDAQGVRSAGSALAYGSIASLSNALAMTWRQRHLGSPLALVRANAKIAIPAAIASAVSYLAILWVFANAPIAPSAALRDTSAVFAILIAVVWLQEPMSRARLLAVVLAAAAVPLLRLA